MNRRQFLTGAVAIGGSSVLNLNGPPATGPSAKHHGKDRRPEWRLQYPATRKEGHQSLVVRDFTFPPGDSRRY